MSQLDEQFNTKGIFYLKTALAIFSGSGNPNSVEDGALGCLYIDEATGNLYQKTTGVGTLTGWSVVSGGGGGGAPADATYLTLSLNGTLTNERVFTLTDTTLSEVDGGAGGNYTLGVNQANPFAWTAAHTWQPSISQVNALSLLKATIGSVGQRDSDRFLIQAKSNDGTDRTIEARQYINVVSNDGVGSLFTIDGRNTFASASFNTLFTLNISSGDLVATGSATASNFYTTGAATFTHSSNANFIVLPPIGGNPLSGSQYFSHDTTANAVGAPPNEVLWWGYNVAQGAVQLAGETGMAFSIEGHYQPTFPGDSYTEAHLHYFNASGSPRRLISWTANKSTDAVLTFMSTSTLDIRSVDGTRTWANFNGGEFNLYPYSNARKLTITDDGGTYQIRANVAGGLEINSGFSYVQLPSLISYPATLGVGATMQPLLAGTYDLGTIGSEWRRFYANTSILLGTTAGTAINMNFDGKVGLGIATGSISGKNVIAIKSDTVPSAYPADAIQICAADYAAGDARLRVYSENGAQPVTIGGNAVLCGRQVVAKTANYTIQYADSNKVFTNVGASGTVTFTSCGTGVIESYTFEFVRVANQPIVLQLNPGEIVQIGSSVTTAGGSVTLDAVGSRLRIVQVDSSLWMGDLTGTATFA